MSRSFGPRGLEIWAETSALIRFQLQVEVDHARCELFRRSHVPLPGGRALCGHRRRDLRLVLFFPLFLLAFVGVLAGLEDRTVHQHNPSMDPNAWGDG
jgi:hypothetical protein